MNSLPPGPRGVIRVTLRQARDPIGTAERWRREYGDPMSFPPQQGKPLLVVGSPAAVRTVFGAPPETFAPLFVDRLAAILGEGSLLALAGAEHSAMRKLLLPPFHGQRMRLYGKTLCDIAREQTQALKPGDRFVAQQLMHTISLQAIIRLVFGVTKPERVARTEKLISDYRHAVTRAVLPIIVPFLRRNFWGFGPWARLQRTMAALRTLIDEEVAQRRADSSERSDILSLLLSARHEDGSQLGDGQIFEQLLTLLFAGHSTTAMSLVWAIHRLLEEPEQLDRLQSELAALGPQPDPEAVAKAPFLEAVCHETLRLYPAAAAAGRQLARPLEVAGHALPVGAGVIVSILWSHYNAATFAEPFRFLPQRFLDRTYTPFEFLPFGGGNRRCIGAAFGLYEMKLVLATLLRRFRFERAAKKPLRVVQFVGLEPSGPVKLRVRERRD